VRRRHADKPTVATAPPPSRALAADEPVIRVIAHPQCRPIGELHDPAPPLAWRPAIQTLCPADLGFLPGAADRDGHPLQMFMVGSRSQVPDEARAQLTWFMTASNVGRPVRLTWRTRAAAIREVASGRRLFEEAER